jgi:hypothetical protein
MSSRAGFTYFVACAPYDASAARRVIEMLAAHDLLPARISAAQRERATELRIEIGAGSAGVDSAYLERVLWKVEGVMGVDVKAPTRPIAIGEPA